MYACMVVCMYTTLQYLAICDDGWQASPKISVNTLGAYTCLYCSEEPLNEQNITRLSYLILRVCSLSKSRNMERERYSTKAFVCMTVLEQPLAHIDDDAQAVFDGENVIGLQRGQLFGAQSGIAQKVPSSKVGAGSSHFGTTDAFTRIAQVSLPRQEPRKRYRKVRPPCAPIRSSFVWSRPTKGNS